MRPLGLCERSHQQTRNAREVPGNRTSQSCARLVSRDASGRDSRRLVGVPEERAGRSLPADTSSTRKKNRRVSAEATRSCQREPLRFARFSFGARTVFAAVVRRRFSFWFFFRYAATSGAISST